MDKILIIVVIILGFIFYENLYLENIVIKYESKKIPKDFNDFRILQISDFHNKRFLTNNYFINKVRKANPDIIVITGDIINSRNPNYKIIDEILKELVKIAPIYYTTGNHEERLKDFSDYMEKMKDLGVIVLLDENRFIEKGDSFINIIGVNDLNYYGIDYLIEKVEKSIVTDRFNILLSHRPEIFEDYIKTNVDLVFTGHTHGGQIRIPFIGALYVPSQGFFPKYDYGVYKDRDTTMILSKGIGSSLINLRLFSNPEIVLLVLKNI